MNARFMPDGQTIVYSAASRGHEPSLYVIGPSAEAPQRLDVPGAHLLSVSRNGELALIVKARHLTHRLYAGTLARMTIGSSPRPLLEHVREADWGSGRRVPGCRRSTSAMAATGWSTRLARRSTRRAGT